MKINNTFPTPRKQTLQLHHILRWIRWPFLAAVIICPLVNLWVGGKAWSVIVLYSMWILWTNLFNPAMVDYNRVSQCIRLIVQGTILLILIDVLIVPGWIFNVAPIFCFGGLIVAGVLFFSDFHRQRHNMMPLLLLTLCCLIGAIVGLTLPTPAWTWTIIVLGSLSLALLVACIATTGKDFFRIIHKHFHLK